MAGAVLAAGCGSRMSGRYDWLPKALLPVAGRPLLAHQLDLLCSLGVRRTVVLVGHLKETITDYLDVVRAGGADVEVVEQPTLAGPGHGLLCLKSRLRGPFVLLLGDIVLFPARPPDLVSPLLEGRCEAVLGVSWETDPGALHKNFRVDLDPQGRVVRVVEKPTGCEPALKGCGVYGFTPAVFEALERTPPNARGELGITEPIQTLIDLGHEVRAARLSSWDVNLTTPEDLEASNRRWLDSDGGRGGSPCSG